LCENNVLKQLCSKNIKASVKLLIDGRGVEIVRRPGLEGRLEVVVKREPKNSILMYKEVYSILSEVEKHIGMKIVWEKPFSRGSY